MENSQYTFGTNSYIKENLIKIQWGLFRCSNTYSQAVYIYKKSHLFVYYIVNNNNIHIYTLFL